MNKIIIVNFYKLTLFYLKIAYKYANKIE